MIRRLAFAAWALAGVLSVVASVMLVRFWRSYDEIPAINYPTATVESVGLGAPSEFIGGSTVQMGWSSWPVGSVPSGVEMRGNVIYGNEWTPAKP